MTQDRVTFRGRVGTPDRVQRLVVGLLLMTLTVIGLTINHEWSRWASLIIQVELVGTALVGWCPLYWSFGRDSCSPRGVA